MMNKDQKKWLLYVLAFMVVGYPLLVRYDSASFSFGRVALFEIFPAFGIVAFTVMWLHIVGGAFKARLEKIIDFQKFVDVSSLVVLISLILHPVLMYLAFALNGGGSPLDYVAEGREYLILIAVVAWLVFISYDVLKKYKGKDIVIKYWFQIKLASTLGFFLVLYHSLGVGRDLQDGGLRTVWILYGITAAVATIYSYVYKPLKKK